MYRDQMALRVKALKMSAMKKLTEWSFARDWTKFHTETWPYSILLLVAYRTQYLLSFLLWILESLFETSILLKIDDYPTLVDEGKNNIAERLSEDEIHLYKLSRGLTWFSDNKLHWMHKVIITSLVLSHMHLL